MSFANPLPAVRSRVSDSSFPKKRERAVARPLWWVSRNRATHSFYPDRTEIIKTYSPDLIVHTDLNEHLCVTAAPWKSRFCLFSREAQETDYHSVTARNSRSRKCSTASCPACTRSSSVPGASRL